MIKSVAIICAFFCATLLYSQEKEAPFVLCGDSICWPYYYPDLTIKGDFWDVKKHYNESYPESEFKSLENNTGIITVTFKVNCKGESGDFSEQHCDFIYQPNVMDEKIIHYFLAKSKRLTGWISGRDDKENPVNHHKFFSFRIKEGVLIQILPK